MMPRDSESYTVIAGIVALALMLYLFSQLVT